MRLEARYADDAGDAAPPSAGEPRAGHGLPARFELGAGEVHLWRADLARHLEALPTLEHSLAPQETAQARRFRRASDRRRYVFAHGVLRTLLARYLQVRPGEPVFRSARWGKPELAGGAIRFSLSHSHDLVFCAVSRTHPVGVDVERVRPGVERDLAGFLPAGVRRRLDELPEAARRCMLLQGWTRLEAWAKARGEGLESGLATFETFVGDDRARFPRVRTEREQRWWLQDITPRQGYVGALATGARTRKVRSWVWEAHEMCPGNAGIQCCRGDS
jgi:4'-phosphopantetheinyl transferase